jgi:serine/threonine protein phosphatase PrpC
MGNLLGAPVTTKETHTGAMDCGKFGVSSMQGWRISMEDMHIAETHLYAYEHNVGGKPVKHPLDGHALFAVFDGHGGSFAAIYAGKNFCRILSRQPKFIEYAQFVKEKDAKLQSMDDNDKKVQYVDYGISLLKEGLTNAFLELDMEIACASQGHVLPDADEPYHPDDHGGAAAGGGGGGEDGENNLPQGTVVAPSPAPPPPQVEVGDSGTTVCVVLITPELIVCANAGDSRSVLGREGQQAVPLSFDHKPDDESEAERIRAAGGYVAMGRVEGDLAVSRGLGDYRFKNIASVMSTPSTGVAAAAMNGMRPLVTANDVTMKPSEQKVSPVPDIVVVSRDNEQERFIVVACDGIFDVMTNRDLVEVTDKMFREGEGDLGLVCEEVGRSIGRCVLVLKIDFRFLTHLCPCFLSPSQLCDIALARGSKDNMTVVTIQFTGQEIGPGGGISARRELRNKVGSQSSNNVPAKY